MVSFLALAISMAVAIQATPVTIDYTEHGEQIMVPQKDGTFEVINTETWNSRLLAAGVQLSVPEIDHEFLNFTADPSHNLKKRNACHNYATAVITDRTEYFVDWDVQMSPVVCAVGAMDISVMNGFTASNSITVSVGADFTIVEDVFKVSSHIDYSHVWTTQVSVTTKGTVNNGWCGVMITKPLTVRKYGRILHGCPGHFEQAGTFMASDRGHGSYQNVDWISGAISMCTKHIAQPPLSRCTGMGNFD